MDDADAVAQLLGYLQAMGGHEDSLALQRQRAQQRLEQARADRIHADHWLIDDQDLGIVQQRSGHDQALFHTVGVGLDQFVTPVGQAEEVERLVCTSLARFRGYLVEPTDKTEKLAASKLLVHKGPVRYEAANGFGRERGYGEVLPAQDYPPSRGLEQPHHHANGGRFPRAVRTQEAKDLTWGDVEAQVMHGEE